MSVEVNITEKQCITLHRSDLFSVQFFWCKYLNPRQREKNPVVHPHQTNLFISERPSNKLIQVHSLTELAVLVNEECTTMKQLSVQSVHNHINTFVMPH